jgi:hypothetical protein
VYIHETYGRDAKREEGGKRRARARRIPVNNF